MQQRFALLFLQGRSECTLVPVFVPGEHSPKLPFLNFLKPPFWQPPESWRCIHGDQLRARQEDFPGWISSYERSSLFWTHDDEAHKLLLKLAAGAMGFLCVLLLALEL